MLPKDPNLLLCIVNTKLRDKYFSLEALCDDLCEDSCDIESILNSIGYYYDNELNQFKPK